MVFYVRNFNFEITFGGGGWGGPHTRLGAGATYTNMTVFTSTSLNTFPTIVSFSAPEISLYLFYSRERKLLLLLEKEKKRKEKSSRAKATIL